MTDAPGQGVRKPGDTGYGEQLDTLMQAGPIVARNWRDLLNIRHSSPPDDRRTVGYELFVAE